MPYDHPFPTLGAHIPRPRIGRVVGFCYRPVDQVTVVVKVCFNAGRVECRQIRSTFIEI